MHRPEGLGFLSARDFTGFNAHSAPLVEEAPPPALVETAAYTPEELLVSNGNTLVIDVSDYIAHSQMDVEVQQKLQQLLAHFPLAMRAALIGLVKEWHNRDRFARYHQESPTFESGEFLLTANGDPVCSVADLHYSYPTLTVYGKRSDQHDERELLKLHKQTVYDCLVRHLLTGILFTVYFRNQ